MPPSSLFIAALLLYMVLYAPQCAHAQRSGNRPSNPSPSTSPAENSPRRPRITPEPPPLEPTPSPSPSTSPAENSPRRPRITPEPPLLEPTPSPSPSTSPAETSPPRPKITPEPPLLDPTPSPSRRPRRTPEAESPSPSMSPSPSKSLPSPSKSLPSPSKSPSLSMPPPSPSKSPVGAMGTIGVPPTLSPMSPSMSPSSSPSPGFGKVDDPRPSPNLNPSTTPSSLECESACSFTLCDGQGLFTDLDPAPYIILRSENDPSREPICKRNNERVQSILNTAEAKVLLSNGSAIDISDWNPAGLRVRFPSNFFKASVVRDQVDPRSARMDPPTGISVGARRGNQWALLHDQCFILPIRSYRRLTPGGGFNTVRTNGNFNDCVAFRTLAPTFHAQMVWMGKTDGDLLLETPDSVVDFLTPFDAPGSMNRAKNSRSAVDILLQGSANVRGALVQDVAKGVCRPRNAGGYTEDIIYLPGNSPPRGRYEIEAWQAEACPGVNRKFEVTLRYFQQGNLMGSKSELIMETSMNYTRVLRRAFQL